MLSRQINKPFLSALLITLLMVSTGFADTQTQSETSNSAAQKAQKAADQEAYRPIAEGLGLSVEELLARDNILMKVSMSLPQTFMNRVEAEPSYAGSWVQHQPEPLMFIAFSGTEGYQRGKALVSEFATEFGGFWVDYVEVRQVTISQAELRALRNKFIHALSALGIRFGSGEELDESKSHFYVRIDVVQPVKTVEAQLLKAGIKPSPFVKIVQVPELAVPFSSLYGGMGLAANRTGRPSVCTSGFSVQNAAGTRGVLTAAHCPDTLYRPYVIPKPIGRPGYTLPFKGEQYGGSYDIQWNAGSQFSVTNSIVGETTARVTGDFPKRLQRVGDMICKSGMLTGKTCGVITRLTDTHPAFPLGPQTYVQVSCNPGTVDCALGGDSGSPVYRKFTAGTQSNLVAYGELVGGAQQLNFFTYMPIDYISTLGVSVLTQ